MSIARFKAFLVALLVAQAILLCCVHIPRQLRAYDQALAEERSVDFSEAYSLLNDNAFTFTNSDGTVQELDKAVQMLQLRAGDRVADVGCGNGLYTFAFARHVGPQGVAYGVDINADLIENLRIRAGYERLANVMPILSKETDVSLPPQSVRAIMLKDVTHCYIAAHDDQQAFLTMQRPFHDSMYHALVPGGYVLIIDDDEHGRATREEVTTRFTRCGFVVAGIDETRSPEGARYHLLLQRPAQGQTQRKPIPGEAPP